MTLNLRRKLVYLIAVAASLVIAAFAFVDLSTTASYGPYIALDSLMKRNQTVSAAAVSEYAKRLSKLPETCRTDVWNSVIAVATRNVRQEETSLDRQTWIAALRLMDPLLRTALGCMPTNGQIWARLAVVQWLLGGSGDEQVTLLVTSQAYAPNELQALELRMVQWRRVTPYVLQRTQNAMRSDIRAVLTYAPSKIVAEFLANIPDSMAPVVKDEFALITPERKAKLGEDGFSLDAKG